MEIIDQYYVVRHSKNGFATSAWPYPGMPVGWEDADRFYDLADAEKLLRECERAGMGGHVAVLEVGIKSRMGK